MTRPKYTVDGALRGEVGHGAGKRWKVCVQTGLSLFGSACRLPLQTPRLPCDVGLSLAARKGMRAAPLPRCTVTSVLAVVSVPRVLGVPAAQPAAAAVGARAAG